ncbi:MAG: PEP-CTERM sorting domain-containing protein [Gammaproteobacteria bacterium]
MVRATLYRLNGTNVENAILADALMQGNAVYRNGQEVLVDTASNTVENTGIDGTWVVTPTTSAAMGKVSYSFDIAATSLWDPTQQMTLALHWAMSCANDAVEGQTLLPPQPLVTVAGIRVAEPASLGLAMLGLAGAGWRWRRTLHA